MSAPPKKTVTVDATAAAPLMYSPESEKLLLSTILNESKRDLADALFTRIAHADFHIDEHAAVWRAAQSLNENRLNHDVTAIIDYSRRSNIFIGGTNYVLDLAEDPVASVASVEAIKAAGDRVKELSVLRKLKFILTTGLSLCENSGQPHDHILSLLEDDLLNLRKSAESNRSGPVHLAESLGSLMERFERQMDGDKIGTGITTGFEELDAVTSGLVDEDFVIIAARPSMGKTAFALNLARNGAAAGQPALIFSLEMRAITLSQRLLGSESRVELSSLRTLSPENMLTDDSWSRLTDGLHKLSELPVWIDDTPGLTIHDIRARARKFVAEHGKCTIYVDYIQHISQHDRDEPKNHVTVVSRSLKGLARELKGPVVGLSQLNRELEKRANKRPIMSDLRESGALEQDADVIMFIYRDEVYNPDTTNPGVAEVIIGKQRDGAVGVIPLAFEKRIGLFSSISY